MAVLLLADHDGARLKPATRSALAAAGGMAEDGVTDLLLLADTQAGAALAAEAAALPGLKRVRLAEAQNFAHPLPEQTAPLLARLMDDYDALIAPVGSFAKTHLPRAAALLDVQPVTEVLAVEDARTFLRPLYAGNALAKVRSLDKKRLVTVRAAAFEPVAAEGGSAAVEPLEAGLLESALAASGGGAEGSAPSRWVGDETTKSERPDLANARVVISGGRGMQDGGQLRASGEGRRTSSKRRSGPPERRWMRASSPTSIRSARPARWLRPNFTSRSGSQGRSSIWRG